MSKFLACIFIYFAYIGLIVATFPKPEFNINSISHWSCLGVAFLMIFVFNKILYGKWL